MPELLIAAAVLAVIMLITVLVKLGTAAIVTVVAGGVLAATAIPFADKAMAKAKTKLGKFLVVLAFTPVVALLAVAGAWTAHLLMQAYIR